MELVFSNMEKSYFCTANVMLGDCMYEFAIRSVPSLGLVVNVLDEHQQEFTPVHIDTLIQNVPALFSTEEEKQQYKWKCASETGWVLKEYGADFHQEESQRAMTPGELEAYELVKANIPKEMVVS